MSNNIIDNEFFFSIFIKTFQRRRHDFTYSFYLSIGIIYNVIPNVFVRVKPTFIIIILSNIKSLFIKIPVIEIIEYKVFYWFFIIFKFYFFICVFIRHNNICYGVIINIIIILDFILAFFGNEAFGIEIDSVV